MDSLLTRLFTKTNELRETRNSMNVLSPTIVNLCMDCSENNMPTRDPTSKAIHFDEANLPKSLILLENLQFVLNGTPLAAPFPQPSPSAYARAAVRDRPQTSLRSEQAAGLALCLRERLHRKLGQAEPPKRPRPGLHDYLPQRTRS